MQYTIPATGHEPVQSRFPAVFPGGGPLYWADEATGELSQAVAAFFRHAADRAVALPDPQLALVIAYCRYFIRAPCWQSTPHVELLRAVIDQVDQAATFDDLVAWFDQAGQLGIVDVL